MNVIRSIAHWLGHQATGFVGHALGTVLFMGVWTFFKSWRDNYSFSYYWDHPTELFSPAVISILAMLSLGLGRIVFDRNKLVANQKKMLASFGVRLFSRHDSEEARKSDWTALAADLAVASKEHSPLWIMGATGKETFSAASSPLFDVIRNYEGEVKILLIKPKSFAFHHRCKGLKVADDDYLEQILDSIEFCKETVARKNRSIELKLYESLPIWKMILTSRALWVQYYTPTDHVENTPLYCFEYRSEAPTLFEGFRAIFQERWSHGHNQALDLKAFLRASWETSCPLNQLPSNGTAP